MSLLHVVRKAVKIADAVTKSLQADVTYERFLIEDEYGKQTFASPVRMRAIVEWKQRSVRTISGELTVSRSYVMFLNITAVIIATAGEGFDPKDRITLPDNTTGPILSMTGFMDAGTGHPIATEVYLG